MQRLTLDVPPTRPARVLFLGAHADDIEIGAGGTALRLIREHPGLQARWVVFSAHGERAAEATAGAEAFLPGAVADVSVHEFRDGFLPTAFEPVKERLLDVARTFEPDLVLTHRRQDLHQDHRMIGEITWQVFRDHLILEYEVPKFDGDLSTPNLYVHLDVGEAHRKVDSLLSCFPSQRARAWFSEETFLGLLRLRGIESRAPDGYAEGFHGAKVVI
jgi:LmbE family N-acetylglucosaminyl deacetylase